ncbi:phosphatase PAP2 family protein [Flectobacillus longus]|uniref:phosphatase PAP2 family protein n=1 Tax=Flectobacillus longus TaxID=2984207 RepID=UPI0024B82EAD|nr:phosphatase PAP2 family protein [Flectobacillus longus]MDI9882017.1 phosphatase PAP2 family protein [Flectobacillus longus]
MKKSNRSSVLNIEDTGFERFSVKNILGLVIFTPLFFFWYIKFIGLLPEHIILYVLFVSTYFGNKFSREIILSFAIYVVYWAIYDSFRVFPNYQFNTVHIQQPYELDKALFGVNYQGQLLTLSEYFAKVHIPLFDVLAGIFYINWVPIPIALSLYFYLKKRPLFYSFAYCFVFVNFLGWIVYYAYPAAPPWYVADHGFALNLHTQGSEAGLRYFDQILDVNLFKGMYVRNSNVFAAMPSLHSAFPLITLYYGLKAKLGWFNIFFVIFCLGIWGAAVYTSHHYVIDVLCGISVASLGIFLFEKFLDKRVQVMFVK